MLPAPSLRRFCLELPGAAEELPFGEGVSVFKVRGKMFALSRLAARPLSVSLKCEPALARQLRDSYDLVVSGLPKRVQAELGWPPASS